MATRVNIKFLLILVIVLFTTVGIIGGLWFLQRRSDTERHIRQGDQFMAEGEYRNAYDIFGRAVAKQPGNLDYLKRMEAALFATEPIGRDDANELYLKRVSILKHAARYHRLDPIHHQALIDELLMSARMSRSSDWWEQVGSASEDMWNQVASSDPRRIDARLYRGMAAMRRTMLLSDREFYQAEEDVQAYLEEHPGSDIGWTTLLGGYLAQAQKHRAEGDARGYEEMMAAADETYASANDRLAEGPEFSRGRVIYLGMKRYADPDSVSSDALKQAARTMIDQVQASGDSLLIRDTAELLVNLAYLGFMPQGAEMLDAHVRENPDAHTHRMLLAYVQYRSGNLDAAEENALYLLDAETKQVGFVALYMDVLQRQSVSLLVDVAQKRWEQASEDEKAAELARIDAVVEQLAARTADPENDPLLRRAQGKLAFAQGDYRTAAARFDGLSRGGFDADPEVLLYGARSLEMINETGLAYERVKQLQKSQSTNPTYLYECGRLAYKLRDYSAAADWIDQLLELHPDHAYGRQLAGRIDIEQSGGDAADLDPEARAITDASTMLKEGQTEAARAALKSVLKEDPDNTQIIYALMQVEIAAGRSDEAIGYIDTLLEHQPSNERLQALRFTLANEDRIAAVEQFVQSKTADPGEHAVAMLLNLSALAAGERKRAEYLEANGDAERAAEALALADRAEAEAGGYLEQARTLAPRDPALQEYLFRDALSRQDWSAAQSAVDQARRENADLAGGTLFAGQLAIARGNPEQAVIELNEAVAAIPHSSLAWRNLAFAYEQSGNFAEAKEAYEQAYRNNPTDVGAVRRYVALLLRVGDSVRALRVIRAARRLVPDDRQLREAWLRLEATEGDPVVVMTERRAIHAQTPEDQVNAIQLARFLATTTPQPKLMRDATGEMIISELRWGTMEAREQQRLIQQTRNDWYGECDRILTNLEESTDDELTVFSLRADLLRERGQIDVGERVLTDFIESTPPDEVTVSMLLTLAQYQEKVGRLDRAVATVERAQEMQDPAQLEADLALGDLYFKNGRFAEAIAALDRVAKLNPNRNLQLRIVECHAKLGQYTEARRRLQAVVRGGETSYFDRMLAAAIADGDGNQAYAVGRLEQAESLFAERDAALEEAIVLGPSHPEPYIQQAQWLLRAYRRLTEGADPDEIDRLRRQTSLLDDAMRALTRADDVRAGGLQTSLARVAVLQAQGERSGAVGELNRLLARSPDEMGARRQLIQMLYEQGDLNGAIAVLDGGIERNPTLTAWYQLKGDLYLNELQRRRAAPNSSQSQLARLSQEAVSSFAQAFEIEPTPFFIGKLVGAQFRSVPPDYQGAAQVLLSREEEMDESPALRALYARALQGMEREAQAREQLRMAYAGFVSGAERGTIPMGNIGIWQEVVEQVFQGEPPSAIESFVLDLTGGETRSIDLNWLALLWARSGADGMSRALELQQMAIDTYEGENRQTLAEMQFRYASYLLADNQFDASVQPLTKVIELMPDHLQARNNIAYVLAEHRKQPQAALEHAERAVALLSEKESLTLRASVMDTLGWIQHQLGNDEDAETLLRRSINVQENANNRFHLATVLATEGAFEAAQVHLDRAAELGPTGRVQGEIEQLAADIRNRRIPDRGGD